MRLLFALLAFVAACASAQDNGQALYEQARAREREGKGAEAVKKRLEELFQRTGSKPRKPLIGDFPTKAESERDRPSLQR